MKKFMLFLAVTLLTFALVSCGGSGGNGGGNDTEDIVLTYAAWNLGSADSETPNMERLMLEEFEKAHPGVKVEVVERPKVPGTTAQGVAKIRVLASNISAPAHQSSPSADSAPTPNTPQLTPPASASRVRPLTQTPSARLPPLTLSQYPEK